MKKLNSSNATFGSNIVYTDMFDSTYPKINITVRGAEQKTWLLDKISTANVIIE